jgi:uncharacterized protein Yka (UPF0111/DUF47 family)
MLAVKEVDNLLDRLDKRQERELFSKLLQRHQGVNVTNSVKITGSVEEISNSLENITPEAFAKLTKAIGLYEVRGNIINFY